VELLEQLRREHELGIGTVKGAARRFGVHRRLVRQAVESALPPLRSYRPRAKPVVGPVAAFIDAILAADATAPRKQRHTARRIHRRILAELPLPLVNAGGCIAVHADAYSVPLRPGRKVRASLHAADLAVWHGAARVARHERCHSRGQQVLDLDHYLEVLERKPEADGRQDGTRAMVGVILLARQFGHDRLRAAVALAVARGACDVGAVRYLLTAGELPRSPPAAIEIGPLARYDRPVPTLAGYDRLLTGRGAA
jgi:hypothetical protein